MIVEKLKIPMDGFGVVFLWGGGRPVVIQGLGYQHQLYGILEYMFI